MSSASILLANGIQLLDHGTLVPHKTGDAISREGGWVDGCLGLHGQQFRPVGNLDEQSFKNYQVRVYG